MNKRSSGTPDIITMNERLDILPNGNILIEIRKISAITTQSLEDTDAKITGRRDVLIIRQADQYTYSSSYDYADGLCR